VAQALITDRMTSRRRSRAASRFQGVEVVLVAGDRDEFATEAALARHSDVLAEHRVFSRVVRYPGGHSIDPTILRDLCGP